MLISSFETSIDVSKEEINTKLMLYSAAWRRQILVTFIYCAGADLASAC